MDQVIRELPRNEQILHAAMRVLGRLGYKKTTIDDIAKEAKISKQGLYLHFSSKQAVFTAALKSYLDAGLEMVHAELSREDLSLYERVFNAMDAWFGRHFETFSRESFDVIEVGDQLSPKEVELYKKKFKSLLSKAFSNSDEFQDSGNICLPAEVAEVLFLCGLSWTQKHATRKDFMKTMSTSIRACCQVR